MVELGGADAIVFTGGIGENGAAIRSAVCRDLLQLGIELDTTKNKATEDSSEREISSADSRTQVWVVPTNEEIIAARQTKQLLAG